jgi:hypothetical protein
MTRATALLPALLLAAWGGWEVSFALYFGVVAPTARQVLGSPPTVGLITQQVSWWFLAGGLLLAGATVAPASAAWRAGARGWGAALAVWTAALLAQAALHPLLDQHLCAATAANLDRPQFRPFHRAYLALALLQWGAGLWLTWLQARWLQPRP